MAALAWDLSRRLLVGNDRWLIWYLDIVPDGAIAKDIFLSPTRRLTLHRKLFESRVMLVKRRVLAVCQARPRFRELEALEVVVEFILYCDVVSGAPGVWSRCGGHLITVGLEIPRQRLKPHGSRRLKARRAWSVTLFLCFRIDKRVAVSWF